MVLSGWIPYVDVTHCVFALCGKAPVLEHRRSGLVEPMSKSDSAELERSVTDESTDAKQRVTGDATLDKRWARSEFQKIADEIITNARSLDPKADDRVDAENYYEFQTSPAAFSSILFVAKRLSVHRERDGRTLNTLLEHPVFFEGHGQGFVQIHVRGDIETHEVVSVDIVSGLETDR